MINNPKRNVRQAYSLKLPAAALKLFPLARGLAPP
jgi:hypothetical protein